MDIADMKPGRETEWLRHVAIAIGLGFHPDTPFGEYIDFSGSRLFSGARARELDGFMDKVFAVVDDPYAVAIDALGL